MQINQSMRLKQKQSMVMTPRLQQAIRMLQMSNVDLNQYLSELALENPFLEVDATSERNEKVDQTTDSVMAPEVNVASLDTAMEAGAAVAEDPAAHSDFENRFESADSDHVWRAELTSGNASSDWDTASLTVADRSDSVYTHVNKQIDLAIGATSDRMIAQLLLEALQPSGWLGKPVLEIAENGGVDYDDVLRVLTIMQGFEPVGLFARDLKECLTIQAKDAKCLTADFELFLEHLNLLAAGEMRALMRKCKCDEQRMQEMLRLVRSFNPKPGEAFVFADARINSPDLVAYKGKDGWIVELNNSTLPAIKIDETYSKMISKRKEEKETQEYAQQAISSARWLKRALEQRNSTTLLITAEIDETYSKMISKRKEEKETQEYAQQAISSARWLKRALEQRNSTTLLITAEIVKQQSAFLEDGINALKPLLLRDVAKEISMHESTVSRVTTGLMISTPRGSFPLKSFFSVALAGQEDDEEGGASAAAVRQMISKMVNEEDPKRPLSDDAIAAKVTEAGIRLARRTVAKYRQILKIPSSAERRRLARISNFG